MTFSTAVILFHICGAVIGLISGFMTMMFRKGSGLHAVAGTVFFVSMLCMSSSAVYIATFLRPNKGNVLVAVLTFYLVATAWVTARRREAKVGVFDRIGFLVVAANGVSGIIWGLQAVRSPAGGNGFPAPAYFIFGTVSVLFAVADVRMIRSGGVAGAKRIARHLVRMSTALLIATLSLYPGRPQVFSEALRQSHLLLIPHILLIGAMVFHLVRVRRSKALSRQEPLIPSPAEGSRS
jgi:uncharacterized membrane protein